ncbi:hypothetical protein BN1058_00928 [Paraliobacillus sp. PM-2]|uniref:DUF1798 family protein n=1 Tax=Paraliobacillus sp. PM-2 TaxID=1462524 RepID=UPI00061C09FD|nr:DUF1798 family protein [Paraliobacillus sp. PM-2]CQR46656.1 hypothetical protein BN1058_00928 [Paraliobacillus sp. PM-2]
MTVKELTIELKETLNQLKDNYFHQDKPENKRDLTFFTYVKEATGPVFQLVEQWEVHTAEEVKKRTLRIHPQQVVSTRENVELLLMHSYYIDVKENRYMNLYNSVMYVLDIILDDLK